MKTLFVTAMLIALSAGLWAAMPDSGEGDAPQGTTSAAAWWPPALEQPQIERMIEQDWAAQDGLYTADGKVSLPAIRKPLEELGTAGAELAAQFDRLTQASASADDPRWLELYRQACRLRRGARLAPHMDKLRRVVFTKHHDMGGSHYAYTEAQSDAQGERNFHGGSALCLLEMGDPAAPPRVRTLIDDPQGVIRDPDVSFDAGRILFSWKKSDRQDDFHLYEMSLADGRVRQLTDGLGFADYEGAYMPNGDIVFNSTRCVQTVDCWNTEVSNLYVCDGDGRYLRRLGYDQVHTNYPTVTDDGRVLYTRWDYNDRSQMWPQGVFQMYPDGTGQTEVYGNNSYFPTAILHARQIPGTERIVATFSGHHTHQQGWLGIIEPPRGRQENQGAQLIAPVRETKADRIDGYGQRGDQFQYPYPLSETAFLVAFHEGLPKFASTPGKRFGVFFMTIDGRREMLAYDADIPCNQSVPLAPRPLPHARASMVDYAKSSGTFCLTDVYHGPGLEGVPRGTIKRLRVVGLEYRAAMVGSNGNHGPAGDAMVSTPVSINGAWDVKVVLGETPVYEDGSACFTVPARVPVYFQALDERNQVVQSMRSWATLQPGEYFSCAGCHEDKNAVPPAGTGVPLASQAGPRELEPWYGPPRGFSFAREVQPVLDRHCVRCHNLPEEPPYGVADFPLNRLRMLLPDDASGWRYTTDAPPEGWQLEGFDDSTWAEGKAPFGVAEQRLQPQTQWAGPRLWLRRQFSANEDLDAAMLRIRGRYHGQVQVYINGLLVAGLSGQARNHTIYSLNEAAKAVGGEAVAPTGPIVVRKGTNVLALACTGGEGGQYVALGLADNGYRGPAGGAEALAASAPTAASAPAVKPAFSLLARPGTWSDSYLALAHPKVASWISPQSEPFMLPPYHTGSARSKLIEMLREGHNGVQLSQEELDRIACWIDLAVPAFGDYTEGMGGGLQKYNHFLQKRHDEKAREEAGIQALMQSRR